MIYRPQKGAIWDPSVLYHDGKYYAFMMYDETGRDGLSAGHCFLATSTEGVHWTDEGIILAERDRAGGTKFFKCFVGKCGDKFIMDHGVRRRQGQDTLRFYESRDLRNWKYITSTQPDERWYQRPGRWDHMYILPKEECNPKAGYWGYVVSIPKEGTNLPGMMQSTDGVKWEVLPPARTEWGKTERRNHLEYGGCERIKGKYYLIGGAYEKYMGSERYSMFTFVGEGPRGPFCPDPEAYRLCGASSKNVSWLASWCRGNGELLISNYASMELGSLSTSMLPLRKPVVDAEGHFRLAWWPANELLKEMSLSLTKTLVTLDAGKTEGGYQIRWLDMPFDLRKGAILEGTIKARAVTTGDNECTAGFVFDEGRGGSMCIQLGIGAPEQRETHIGRLLTEPLGTPQFVSEDVTGRGCATVTGIEDGKEHTFRLLVRLDMFELYINDLLMQTYAYKPSGGKLGFLARKAEVVFSDLKAWSMSLAAEASFELPTIR